MARLPYLEKSDLAPENQDLLAREINLAKILAHSPGGARSFVGIGHWIRDTSNLDPRLRELAILTVGYLTEAEYEYSHHIKIGRDFGLSDDDIRAIADGTDGAATGIDPTAQLVLSAAREMTLELAIGEATFRQLHERLGEEGILDLTLVISFYNGVVRLLKTLEVDVEPEYQPYLAEFPL